MTLILSSRLNGQTQKLQPKVVQVWFESAPMQTVTGATALGPTPLLALHGDQKWSDREVVWAITDEPERTIRLFQSSGRIMLRVHCGHLVDEKERPFCSCVDALIGAASPHVPGGVFEGWFFVVTEKNHPTPGAIITAAPAKKVAAARKRER